jgi:hypothetical protein
MVTNRLALAVVAFLSSVLLACTSSAQVSTSKGETGELDRSVGWMHDGCLAIRNSDLSAGTQLVVVKLGEVQEIVGATILGRASSGKECPALLDDRKAVNAKQGTYFYTVASQAPIEIAIAVVRGKDGKAAGEDEVLDLDKDGHRDSFSQCSTAEGLRFGVWQGQPYKSTMIWSAYYYLGYDTTANCP